MSTHDEFKIEEIVRAGEMVVFRLSKWKPGSGWFRRGRWDRRGDFATEAAAKQEMELLAERPYVRGSKYFDKFGREVVEGW